MSKSLTSSQTLSKTELLNAIKAECAAQYENGWCDLVIETMSDDEILQAVGPKCKILKTAMRRMKEHHSAYAEQRRAVEAEIDEPSMAEQLQEVGLLGSPAKVHHGRTMFIVKVTGTGRGRFWTPDGQLDPWKFHAMQFGTREEAQTWAENNERHGLIVPFPKAWYEKV